MISRITTSKRAFRRVSVDLYSNPILHTVFFQWRSKLIQYGLWSPLFACRLSGLLLHLLQNQTPWWFPPSCVPFLPCSSKLDSDYLPGSNFHQRRRYLWWITTRLPSMLQQLNILPEQVACCANRGHPKDLSRNVSGCMHCHGRYFQPKLLQERGRVLWQDRCMGKHVQRFFPTLQAWHWLPGLFRSVPESSSPCLT